MLHLLRITHCEDASFRRSPLPNAYKKCNLPIGLISLNAVSKNKNTQNAALLKEFWKKRRGATRSRGKPENPKTRKIRQHRKIQNHSEQHHMIESLARGCISQTRSASPGRRTYARPLISWLHIADPRCIPKRPYVCTSPLISKKGWGGAKISTDQAQM